MDEVLAGPISVVVMDSNMRTVNWELFKVGSSMTVDLGVQVGKDTSLKQRILTKVNAANNMTGLKLRRGQHWILLFGFLLR